MSSVTVKPSGDQERETKRGLEIIRHTIKWAFSLNRQHDIKNWYGIGATEEGQHLFGA